MPGAMGTRLYTCRLAACVKTPAAYRLLECEGDKRRYFELPDVRGKLAVENSKKVVYASCELGKQAPSLNRTSP